MAAKVTRVKLVAVRHGWVKSFDIAHAQRLLSRTKGEWALPDDTEWEVTDGIIGRKRKKGKQGEE